MSLFRLLLDFLFHIDEKLVFIASHYGALAYLVLFGMLFIETGVVIMPFIPGDSLLFAAGSLAGMGDLNIWLLLFLGVLAAFLGDTANYWIGRLVGFELVNRYPKFIKKKYLDKAQSFYEKHGGFAIVLARFVPIVRTFAPFVAGIGEMTYAHFLMFNIMGGIFWVCLFTLLGFFFGHLPVVQQHFELAMIAIILISVVPIATQFLKAKWQSAQSMKKIAINPFAWLLFSVQPAFFPKRSEKRFWASPIYI